MSTVSPRAKARPVRGRLGYGLLLLPASLSDLAGLVVGGVGRGAWVASDRWRRRAAALSPVDVGDGPVPPARVAALSALGVPLGLVVWVLAAFAALTTVRGPFYGFVDPGPWTDAWGGPTLPGAWAVHALVWLLLLPVWFGLGAAVVALHVRLTAQLLGPERRWWVLPVAALLSAAVAAFVLAWSRQI